MLMSYTHTWTCSVVDVQGKIKIIKATIQHAKQSHMAKSRDADEVCDSAFVVVGL